MTSWRGIVGGGRGREKQGIIPGLSSCKFKLAFLGLFPLSPLKGPHFCGLSTAQMMGPARSDLARVSVL
jgi:hypothetical protein